MEPDVPKEKAEAIAAMCALIGRIHGKQGLPYALRYMDSMFDVGTGKIKLGPGCVGFTCSTFVLGLFRSCRITLLKQEEWQPRQEDGERQKTLVHLLERYVMFGDATPEHLETVQKEIGCVRFSPIDVGVAGWGELPMSFDQANERGPQLRKLLSS